MIKAAPRLDREQFTKGNRPELAAKEAAEIVVIEEFLPKALDEAGLGILVPKRLPKWLHPPAKRPLRRRWAR